MVVAVHGVIVECDEPTMEIIRSINEIRGFVIDWLDSTHVMCKLNVFEFLEEEVTRRLEMAERQTSELNRENRALRKTALRMQTTVLQSSRTDIEAGDTDMLSIDVGDSGNDVHETVDEGFNSTRITYQQSSLEQFEENEIYE
eukprot:GHVQ01004686.1.p1 GENE.GHVQ01004686.1~~GHVQ01004686.1.p1  ORF type:complete len:143 (+),score=17.96 GHVQ01004686.1:257-685(+)